MAKTQTFGDKAKKVKQSGVYVKVVKAYKSEAGNYKFQERFEKLDDINKVTEIK